MPEDRDPERPDSVDGDPRSDDPGLDDREPDDRDSGDRQQDDRSQDVWTGRAGVRPYAAVPRDPFESEGDWADPAAVEPAGRWWAPIAVGTVCLVLLALLGLGIMVIVQNTGDDADQPAATPPAARVTTDPAAPGATTPTAGAGTFPTTPTTDAADAEVTVPALRGMPLADAQAALSRSGLGWRVIRRESDAEPDTVIDCDPAEGQQVPSDTRVTLIVSTAQPAPPSSVPSAGASG